MVKRKNAEHTGTAENKRQERSSRMEFVDRLFLTQHTQTASERERSMKGKSRQKALVLEIASACANGCTMHCYFVCACGVKVPVKYVRTHARTHTHRESERRSQQFGKCK